MMYCLSAFIVLAAVAISIWSYRYEDEKCSNEDTLESEKPTSESANECLGQIYNLPLNSKIVFNWPLSGSVDSFNSDYKMTVDSTPETTKKVSKKKKSKSKKSKNKKKK